MNTRERNEQIAKNLLADHTCINCDFLWTQHKVQVIGDKRKEKVKFGCNRKRIARLKLPKEQTCPLWHKAPDNSIRHFKQIRDTLSSTL